MSDFSPNYNIPLLVTGQTNAHLTVNEALQRLEQLANLTVESTTVANQPSSPQDGQAWLLIGGASGVDWATHGGEVAFYLGGWHFITPKEGLVVWDAANQTELRHTQGVWISSGSQAAVSGVHTLCMKWDDFSADPTRVYPIMYTPGRILIEEIRSLLSSQIPQGANLTFRIIQSSALYGGGGLNVLPDTLVTDGAQGGANHPSIAQPLGSNPVWLGLMITSKNGAGADDFCINLRYRKV